MLADGLVQPTRHDLLHDDPYPSRHDPHLGRGRKEKSFSGDSNAADRSGGAVRSGLCVGGQCVCSRLWKLFIHYSDTRLYCRLGCQAIAAAEDRNTKIKKARSDNAKRAQGWSCLSGIRNFFFRPQTYRMRDSARFHRQHNQQL